MRAAVGILGVCYAATMIAFAVAVPEHVADGTWPDHARNHVLQALLWIEGFCALGLVVAFTACRRGERWAWMAQALAGLFIYGGYFVAIPITGGGAPGPTDDVFFAAVAVLHAAAVVVGARRSRS